MKVRKFQPNSLLIFWLRILGRGQEEYAKERIQAKTIAKLRESSKGSIPFPNKNKKKDDPEKGMGIEV